MDTLSEVVIALVSQSKTHPASNYIRRFKATHKIPNSSSQLKNSVDAHSFSVAIRICPELFWLQVLDNGDGFDEADLAGVGKWSVNSLSLLTFLVVALCLIPLSLLLP